MDLMVIGISHKTAPVDVREKFSFTKKHLEEALINLKKSTAVAGAVILSTCNRTEIYIDPGNGYSGAGTLKDHVSSLYHADSAVQERYFYTLKDLDATRHIIRVASGLESQVIGETQIFNQVKSAWTFARDMETASPRLNEVFSLALKIGRAVRTETKISQGNVSIGSVAIKMLEDRIKNLQDASVLIVGAGKIGSLMANYIKEKKIKGIFVASRTFPRALELAGQCGGRAVDFTKLEEELKNIDIVISSSSSPHIILKKQILESVMRKRKKPLVIMDVAVPRDVDPDAKFIGGISLYDIDDLKSVIEENCRLREKEVAVAEKIIEEELKKYREVNVYA